MEAVNNSLTQYVFTHPGVLAALHNMDLADGMALLSAIDVAIREFCNDRDHAQKPDELCRTEVKPATKRIDAKTLAQSLSYDAETGKVYLDGALFAVRVLRPPDPDAFDICEYCVGGSASSGICCDFWCAIDTGKIPDCSGIDEDSFDYYYRKPTMNEFADEELQRLASKESESTPEEDW